MPVASAQRLSPACAVPWTTGAPLAGWLSGLAFRPAWNWLVVFMYSISDQSETPCPFAARTRNQSDASGSSPLMMAPAP